MVMAQKEEFPAHVQRAIDEAERIRAKGGEPNADLHMRKKQLSLPDTRVHVGEAPEGVGPQPVAKGELRPHKMNKTEAAYAEILEGRRRAGEILWYDFGSWTFKLADDLRYIPDFPTMLADGTLQIDEVKGGFIREDSWIKMKMFTRLFPIRLRLCQYEKGEWKIKII